MGKAFSTERILTVSARDYAEIAGKKLSDYKAVGVSAGTLWRLCDACPPRVEVIVDIRTISYVPRNTTSYTGHEICGTALIPRGKSTRR